MIGGEGLAILHRANVGAEKQGADAETTPLHDPRYYRYEIDRTNVAEVWCRGSVIASWLLDLTAVALLKDPDLTGFTGRVSDSGEGRWTAMAAIDEGVPAHVLTTALYERFASRGEADFADRVLFGDAKGVRRSRREGSAMSLRSPSPQAIVVFGASGDLTRRKILPALYNLARQGLLPDRYAVVGYARTDWDDEGFREHARSAVEEFSRTPLDEASWKQFADSLSYLSGPFDDPSCFDPLIGHLARIDEDAGTEGGRLYYLATPP